MGPKGLRETAEMSALNNNYFMELVKKIPGITAPYAEGHRRLEECRWSWQELTEETGVGTDDILRRVGDFGLQHYWSSHHPWVVPEPMTIEPCETFSKEDIEEYAAVLKHIAEEARTDPELVKQAPHKCAVHKRAAEEELDDPTKWATTWRAYKRKQGLA
jgi:glycine dehydrogenase subunit 2